MFWSDLVNTNFFCFEVIWLTPIPFVLKWSGFEVIWLTPIPFVSNWRPIEVIWLTPIPFVSDWEQSSTKAFRTWLHPIRNKRNKLQRPRLHTKKSFRNLIKYNQNQIVFTIFRLIWYQTDPWKFRLKDWACLFFLWKYSS